MILFFDTETTGLPVKGGLELQPHIVQLAMMLTDKTGKIISSSNFLIRQNNIIPPDSIKIHGKTDEMCLKYGLTRKTALSMFMFFLDRAEILVAHNINFDVRMIENHLEREAMQDFPLIEKVCTQKIYTDKCKIPPTEAMKAKGMKCFKAPRLEEAYQWRFGKMFDNAHDAMADVLACKDLYFSAMQED